MKIIKLIALLILTVWMSLLFAITCDAEESLDTYLSEDICYWCEAIGEMYNISPYLLMAIAEKESTGREDATNGKYTGLMQMNIDYTKEGGMYEGHNLLSASEAIFCAADYLYGLFEEYEDTSLVLDLYSGYGFSCYKNGDLSPYSKWVLNRALELEIARGEKDEQLI